MSFSIRAENRMVEIGGLDWSPFYSFENDQLTGGLCTELLEKLLTELKIPYHKKGYPAKRLYSNLAKGETDLFLGFKDADVYKEDVYFSDRPVMIARVSVLSEKGNPRIFKKEDLKNKRIIAVRGFIYGGFIKYVELPDNKIKTELANNHRNAYEMLASRRAPYLLTYSLSIKEYFDRKQFMNYQEDFIIDIPLYLIVSKKTPNAKEFLKKLTETWVKLNPNVKI